MINRRSFFKTLGVLGGTALLTKNAWAKLLPVDDANQYMEAAWKKLGKMTQRYQFRYIEPVANLPKVFIYGDSISIGYTEYVRQSLTGEACVYRLHENGSASTEFIPKMEAFRKGMFQPDLKNGWDFEWDVIHFNVGLHDLKYLFNNKLDKVNGTQVSSLESYAKNLNEIIKYLKSTYPKAKLIFATTTPVPEGEPGRFAGDEVRFNETARKVLENHQDILINDLCQFSVPLIEKYSEGLGNVHYKPEGSRLQGIEVAGVIAGVLGIEPHECPSAATIVEEMNAYGKATGQKQNAIIH